MTTGNPTRRNLLQASAGLAAGAGAFPAAAILPTVPFGQTRITRLLIGSNPFNGFAYSIPSLGRHMKEWFTPERIATVLASAERNGINTWQFSFYESSMAALKLHRQAGGKLQWLLVTGGAMKDNLGLMAETAKLKPLGIVHHGGVTDQQFRAGQLPKVRDYLKAVRDTGVMVGLSTHLPRVIETVEEQNWDVDFYMACFYQFGRSKEELRKLMGELPLGTVFLEGDPARMCRVIRQTRKTCLGFKILAAGRLAESPEQLERAFRFAFENIKPQDSVIVGMYPRFQDEVEQNAALVRRILTPVS